MTVSTTVVVIVWTTFHVTKKLVTVTMDVIQDIQTYTVAQVRFKLIHIPFAFCIYFFIFQMYRNLLLRLWRAEYTIHFIECSPGQFGLDCRERCSKHCKNSKLCDHISGACTSGCQNGFVGSHCTIGKIFLIVTSGFNVFLITKTLLFAKLNWLGSKVNMLLHQIWSQR